MKLNITIEIDDAEIARLLGRDEPRPGATELGCDEPRPGATELGCGLEYYSRDGQEGPVIIQMMDQDGDFRGSNGCWYRPNGNFIGESFPGPRDLVIPNIAR